MILLPLPLPLAQDAALLKATPWIRPYTGPRRADVDATTLVDKVLCGYQGWFRTPDDGTGQGWFHWSRERDRMATGTERFEMWSDVSEYPPASLALAPGFTLPDGSRARLFTSAHLGVVRRHFEWMRTYGIDGVFVQRFLGGLDGGRGSAEAARVLAYARDEAARTGRVFAVEYDASGVAPAEAIRRMRLDWRFLTDTMHLTEDPRYLRHRGRPVLGIFGFFADRFNGREANEMIDAFTKPDPQTGDHYTTSLVGAGQWWWRREKDPEWQRAFRRFTAYSPWDVGNTQRVGEGPLDPPTDRWREDLAEARRAGMLLLPTIYPGFSWDNLQRKAPGSTAIPRRRGDFFRKGFHAAADLGIGQAFVAMFDEVDEGTAIFKTLDRPPVPGHFLGLEGLPPDAYLRITGEGTRLIHRLIKTSLPVRSTGGAP